MAGTAKLVDVDLSDLVDQVEGLALRDMSGAMDEIAELLTAGVSDKFDQEGPGWPGLAPSTLAKRRGAEAQILSDTGRLAGSIEADSGADFAEATTDVEYAAYHVSDAPRSKIPLRDFFDLPESVFDDAADIVLDHIVNG